MFFLNFVPEYNLFGSISLNNETSLSHFYKNGQSKNWIKPKYFSLTLTVHWLAYLSWKQQLLTECSHFCFSELQHAIVLNKELAARTDQNSGKRCPNWQCATSRLSFLRMKLGICLTQVANYEKRPGLETDTALRTDNLNYCQPFLVWRPVGIQKYFFYGHFSISLHS